MTDCVDHWFCRFISVDANEEVTDATIKDLVEKVGAKYKWVHLEKLQEFDGKLGYTKAQGEDENSARTSCLRPCNIIYFMRHNSIIYLGIT